MKFLMGMGKWAVTEHGIQYLQMLEDTLTVDFQDNQFPRNIWLTCEDYPGEYLANIPLSDIIRSHIEWRANGQT